MPHKLVAGLAVALGITLAASTSLAGPVHGGHVHGGPYRGGHVHVGPVRHGHVRPVGPIGIGVRTNVVVGSPYYATAGVRFSGGYYYRGHDHCHWGPRVWNARYNRYHYWDPNLNCYYYWSAPQNCYFPVGVPGPF